MKHTTTVIGQMAFLYHTVEIIESGKPGKTDTGKAIVTGWCMEINEGDYIDIPNKPIMNIISLTKKDHAGIFSNTWDWERDKDSQKVFWAYKPNEKNKNSHFTATCIFTPSVK